MFASGSRVVQNADLNLVLRIEEVFYGFKQFSGANTQPRQYVRAPARETAGIVATLLQDNVNPAGSTFVEVAGRHVLNIPSAAAVSTRVGNAADNVAMPINQEFNGAGSMGTALLLNRPLRQYIFKVPVRRTVAGTARLELGIVTSSNMLTFVGTPPGCIWSSDPAVNAGNFLPRSRQVTAGAITNGPDSGVAPGPTDWHVLGFRYTEGTTPLIEWLLDDVARHLISGDAAMPDFPGGVNPPGFVPGYGISTPAGSTWQFGAASYEVRNIGV